MHVCLKAVSMAVLLLSAVNAGACISEAPRHNNYLFSVFNRSLMGDRFVAATDAYWQGYLHDSSASYAWDREKIMLEARARADTELLSYCRMLNFYLDTKLDYNSWDYPTKAQIAKRQSTLRNLYQVSKDYKGSRFRSQYALMRMRALFGLKRYVEAATYWQTAGSRLPQSVYRDIMLNIYAGCLWRTGKKSEAIDIYAAQEDYASLKYCVRGYRNLAGIQKVYATNPNSPTLNYLVQDFVNNVQETMDVYQTGSTPFNITAGLDTAGLNSWMKDIDAKRITEAEAGRFIAFARGVVAEGKTKTPCLWQSAIGCIEHQSRRYAEAKDDLAKAMTMAGTPRMKDNARAIYAANSIYAEKRTPAFDRWLTGEMHWLDAKSAEDRKALTVFDTDHYLDVKERMVYNGLVPMLEAKGDYNAALVLLSMMNDTEPWFKTVNARSVDFATDDDAMQNWDYCNTYFNVLDTIPVERLTAYSRYLRRQPSDSLESYAWQRAYRDSNYYNDIIGTRLLAQGRFDDAIPFLEKVSLDFLSTQNIKPYAYWCDYTKERWMGKQKVTLPEYPVTGENQSRVVTLTTNKKLRYCRDMTSLLREYALMREGEARCAKAYQLATLWYQGSYEGDCWWLTQYGISVAQDSTATGTLDFVAKALQCLDESERSEDFGLREKSLYALAFIRHGDMWYETGWDDEKTESYDLDNLKTRPQSRQYKALAALSAFRRDNAARVDAFVSKCDMLRRFEKAL